MTKLKLSSFILIIFIGVVSGARKRRGVLALLDQIEDYCADELSCKEAVTEDLIVYLTNEPYDDDLEYGASRSTILLESVDDKCGNDESCREPLLEILRDRVFEGPDPMLLED